MFFLFIAHERLHPSSVRSGLGARLRRGVDMGALFRFHRSFWSATAGGHCRKNRIISRLASGPLSQAVPPARFLLQASATHGLHRVVAGASSARRCWTFSGLPCARCLLVGRVGNRFRGGIHVAVKFASSAKKNGFNCVSPLMRLYRDATNGQPQTVRSALQKNTPPGSLRRRAGLDIECVAF
jgi:hypothetical protein